MGDPPPFRIVDRMMDAERWARVVEIFSDALELAPEARSDFVRDACGEDPGLRAEVQAMLAAETADEPLRIEERLRGAQGTGDDRRIGHYRLERILGEGGMGIVWLAEQAEPVRRKVALKVLRTGLWSDRILARFDQERQALAALDHPGVARVHDAGQTPEGQPWFAMEWVDGVPITEYCDRHRLDVDQRIALFVSVCRAVQHAHQKAIIHRDLKPSNILITEVDGRPTPKIIDFGIAKALGERLTDRTLVTQAGHLMGTPAYMSPEQADGDDLDIDTRSDVYSLGILLYELLVGALPADLDRLADFVIRRAIHQLPFPRPSVRLPALVDTVDTIVENRRTTRDSLTRVLSGDLDWVVLKAIEKERDRRYDTVSGLAQDLERYLSDEPVQARPPSAGYRLRKFVARHRVGVGATGIIAALLVAFAATMAVQSSRLAAERDRTVVALTKAREISSFMVGLFQAADPNQEPERLTAVELLDRGVARADELSEQPDVQAQMLHAVGRAYQGLGRYDRAEPLLERAVDLQRQLGEEGGEGDLARSLMALASVRFDYGGDFAGLEPLFDEALALARNGEDTDRSDVAQAIMGFGAIQFGRQDYPGAVGRFREALDLFRPTDDVGRELEANLLNNLGISLVRAGEPAEAEEVLRRSLALNRELRGDDHPSVATNLNILAEALLGQGRIEEATELSREVLERRKEIFGPEHPAVAAALNNLGQYLSRQDRFAEAVPYAEEAVTIQRKTLRPGHPLLAQGLENLSDLYMHLERYTDAEAPLLEALEIYRASLGDEHVQTREMVAAAVDLYTALGRPDDAARYANR